MSADAAEGPAAKKARVDLRLKGEFVELISGGDGGCGGGGGGGGGGCGGGGCGALAPTSAAVEGIIIEEKHDLRFIAWLREHKDELLTGYPRLAPWIKKLCEGSLEEHERVVVVYKQINGLLNGLGRFYPERAEFSAPFASQDGSHFKLVGPFLHGMPKYLAAGVEQPGGGELDLSASLPSALFNIATFVELPMKLLADYLENRNEWHRPAPRDGNQLRRMLHADKYESVMSADEKNAHSEASKKAVNMMLGDCKKADHLSHGGQMLKIEIDETLKRFMMMFPKLWERVCLKKKSRAEHNIATFAHYLLASVEAAVMLLAIRWCRAKGVEVGAWTADGVRTAPALKAGVHSGQINELVAHIKTQLLPLSDEFHALTDWKFRDFAGVVVKFKTKVLPLPDICGYTLEHGSAALARARANVREALSPAKKEGLAKVCTEDDTSSEGALEVDDVLCKLMALNATPENAQPNETVETIREVQLPRNTLRWADHLLRVDQFIKSVMGTGKTYQVVDMLQRQRNEHREEMRKDLDDKKKALAEARRQYEDELKRKPVYTFVVDSAKKDDEEICQRLRNLEAVGDAAKVRRRARPPPVRAGHSTPTPCPHGPHFHAEPTRIAAEPAVPVEDMWSARDDNRQAAQERWLAAKRPSEPAARYESPPKLRRSTPSARLALRRLALLADKAHEGAAWHESLRGLAAPTPGPYTRTKARGVRASAAAASSGEPDACVVCL
jgi:hypothetical protein